MLHPNLLLDKDAVAVISKAEDVVLLKTPAMKVREIVMDLLMEDRMMVMLDAREIWFAGATIANSSETTTIQRTTVARGHPDSNLRLMKLLRLMFSDRMDGVNGKPGASALQDAEEEIKPETNSALEAHALTQRKLKLNPATLNLAFS